MNTIENNFMSIHENIHSYKRSLSSLSFKIMTSLTSEKSFAYTFINPPYHQPFSSTSDMQKAHPANLYLYSSLLYFLYLNPSYHVFLALNFSCFINSDPIFTLICLMSMCLMAEVYCTTLHCCSALYTALYCTVLYNIALNCCVLYAHCIN